MTDSLDILLPTTASVETKSGTVTIKPFTFGQLPKVMKHAKGIHSAVSSFDSENLASELLAHAGEDLLELIHLSSGTPRSVLDGLDMDEGVQVTSAFLEVNLSFFVQRVLPQIRGAMAKLQQVTTGVKQ